MIYIGVDTGGTFTDLVMLDGNQLKVHKVLSSPQAPEKAIVRGIKELAIDQPYILIHGSTVATNAVLEEKGVKTLYITNRGFEDVLTIGRQNRQSLYDLQAVAKRPPVPRHLCLGVGGRLTHQGELIDPLTTEDLEAIKQLVEREQPEAVAINLLYSWLRPELERQIANEIPPAIFVSLSSDVSPEIREYERGITTWLNAWVGPTVDRYLSRLADQLTDAKHIAVMQSSAATIVADQAGKEAVKMLLSGPAGGLSGAKYMAGLQGMSRLLTFDMGGTSADVALIEGKPQLTSNGRIGDYPVAIPMLDIHTIGAGGGSQAYLDEAGMLHVGPESAGASPGPVCYGQGGCIPTVTDANLVLGRLIPDQFLGGQLVLDVDAAIKAVQALADQMKTPLLKVAQGIVDLANEHMVRALRMISVERGYDPAEFVLVSFGGAGGLHACALAESLNCQKILIPAHSGVLSALGMLVTPPGRHISRTLLGVLNEMEEADIVQTLTSMKQEGVDALLQEGLKAEDIQFSYWVDVRYLGQSSTLTIAWNDIQHTIRQFHLQHQEKYGHVMDTSIELVNLRVEVMGRFIAPDILPPVDDIKTDQVTYVNVVGQDKPVPVMPRQAIQAGEVYHGPLLITEYVSTSWVSENWSVRLGASGNLDLSTI